MGWTLRWIKGSVDGMGPWRICHCESVKYCILLFIYLFIYLLFSFSNGFISLDVHELYLVCEMCEC